MVQPNTVVVYAQDEVNQINDYMIANIVACLLCCWCIGCCAIMKSNECKNAKVARDLESARRHSESAKNLLIATIVVGIIVFNHRHRAAIRSHQSESTRVRLVRHQDSVSQCSYSSDGSRIFQRRGHQP